MFKKVLLMMCLSFVLISAFSLNTIASAETASVYVYNDTNTSYTIYLERDGAATASKTLLIDPGQTKELSTKGYTQPVTYTKIVARKFPSLPDMPSISSALHKTSNVYYLVKPYQRVTISEIEKYGR